MTRRYEIQEILSQDSRGVVFHAYDREAGADVVLRRFFPFGPEGGGLEGEEREAYATAIGRLKTVQHATLRTILDGGCDPVDGMPFLVTEWVEGDLLSQHLAERPLSPGSAKALLDHALEASQMLARALGEEAVWVETDPAAVILSHGEEGRGVTFWICPLRWLSHNGDRKSLAPLVELGEAAMHWKGRVISVQAGEGLGAWLKSISAHPGCWTLEEARATLHAAGKIDRGEPQTIVNADGPVTPTVAMPAPTPRPVLKHKPSRMPWVVAGLLVLASTGLVVWKKMQGPPARTAAPVAAAEETASNAPSAGGVSENATAPPVVRRSAPPPAVSAESAIERRAAELAAAAAERPNIMPGTEVDLEGVIRSAESSGTGKTLYLEFAVEGESFTRWAGFSAADWPDHDLEKLKTLVGSPARFRGVVKKERSHREFYIDLRLPEDLTVLAKPAP